MAIQREREVPQKGNLFVSQSSLSSTDATFYSHPGQRFLDAYTEWADNPVDVMYPSGHIRRINPVETSMEHRYDVVVSTFGKGALASDIKGTYGEIMGGILLNQVVRDATEGNYTVIPTLPQLDVNGRRSIPDLPDVRDKTADIMLGRVVHGAFEPCMMFDIKSYSRGGREDKNLGVAVNSGLGLYVPVGIVYIGGLAFTDAKGNLHTTASYLQNVVHPAVLENTLAWQTLWPQNARRNSHREIFAALSSEVLTACYQTRQKIYEYKWDDKARVKLLEKLDVTGDIFTRVQKLSTTSSHSAA